MSKAEEIQTASEFFENNIFEDLIDWEITIGENLLQARDREVRLDERRKALMDSAKATCELCRDESFPKSNQTILTWHHGESKVSGEIDWCHAMDIHDLLAKHDKGESDA